MRANKTRNRHSNYSCSLQIINDARSLGRAFYYSEVARGFSYDRKRHVMQKLVKQGKILKFLDENPARFVLPELSATQKDSQICTVNTMGIICAGFRGFVESLDWGELVYVHNVRLGFDIRGGLCRVSESNGWSWVARTKTWKKKLKVDDVRVTVFLYENGHAQIALACGLEPFSLDPSGLWRMGCVLEHVRGCLEFDVQKTGSWVVTSWHYGKDCRNEVSGSLFNVTWHTWAGTMARIYHKRELCCVRVEESQSPKMMLQSILDYVFRVSASERERR